MQALRIIIWFVGICLTIIMVFRTVGIAGIVSMFPEGWRWWMLPVQLISLVLFAAMVLAHPF